MAALAPGDGMNIFDKIAPNTSQGLGKGGATTQDLNVTGDEANAMPVQITPGQTPLRLPGKAGLLFDQIMANNLKAGEKKDGEAAPMSSSIAVTDPNSWAKAGAGNFMPAPTDMSKMAGIGKGGASG